jgi:dUTPase
MSNFRTLYLFTSNTVQNAVLINAVDKWRSTDSGFNIPVVEASVEPTKGKAHKLHTEIYGALVDRNITLVDRNITLCPFLILPRSSTGSKTPLRLANSVGLIDEGYRGELLICVDNLSDTTFEIPAGTLLFQMCAPDFQPFNSIVILNSLEALPSPRDGDNRAEGGFGSTG